MRHSRRSHDARGRHRRADSPETKRWHEISAETDWLQPNRHGIRVMPPAKPEIEPPPKAASGRRHGFGREKATARSQSVTEVTFHEKAKPSVPPPKRPPWLDPAGYQALLELRASL